MVTGRGDGVGSVNQPKVSATGARIEGEKLVPRLL